jgi:hypothetical protein
VAGSAVNSQPSGAQKCSSSSTTDSTQNSSLESDDDDVVESEANSNYDSDYINNDEYDEDGLMDEREANNDSDSNTYFYEEYNAYENGTVEAAANDSNQSTINNNCVTNHSMAGFKKSSMNNLNSSMTGLFNRSSTQMRKKSTNSTDTTKNIAEAGLWWDEDIALNELTLSKSFDFSSQYNLNHHHRNYHLTATANNTETGNGTGGNEEEEEDDDEMRTLEAMLKSSELFSNLANKSKSNANKRFSLA